MHMKTKSQKYKLTNERSRLFAPPPFCLAEAISCSAITSGSVEFCSPKFRSSLSASKAPSAWERYDGGNERTNCDCRYKQGSVVSPG